MPDKIYRMSEEETRRAEALEKILQIITHDDQLRFKNIPNPINENWDLESLFSYEDEGDWTVGIPSYDYTPVFKTYPELENWVENHFLDIYNKGLFPSRNYSTSTEMGAIMRALNTAVRLLGMRSCTYYLDIYKGIFVLHTGRREVKIATNWEDMRTWILSNLKHLKDCKWSD